MKSGSDLLDFFSSACDENCKLFIPSSADEGIAKRLVEHYEKFFSLEVLKKTVTYYVKNTPDPIQISSFAVESSTVREHVLQEQKDIENINLLMQETKMRMERLNESRDRPN